MKVDKGLEKNPTVRVCKKKTSRIAEDSATVKTCLRNSGIALDACRSGMVDGKIPARSATASTPLLLKDCYDVV